MNFFWNGFYIGFLISLPVGPISLMCITSSLKNGFGSGFLVGLGNGVVKGIYSLIGALGISVVTNYISTNKSLIKLCSGIFLIYIGMKVLYSRNDQKSKATKEKPFLESFLLTLVNPMTILGFVAFFSACDNLPNNLIDTILIGVGSFFGSISWWSILAFITSQSRSIFSKEHVKYIGYASSGLIIYYGIRCLVDILINC